MTEPHTSTALAGGAVATGLSLKNSAVARSFSDATWTQVMDGSFEVYMSDILAVVGVLGLAVNIWLGVRKDRRQQKQQQDD